MAKLLLCLELALQLKRLAVVLQRLLGNAKLGFDSVTVGLRCPIRHQLRAEVVKTTFQLLNMMFERFIH